MQKFSKVKFRKDRVKIQIWGKVDAGIMSQRVL